MYQNLRVDTDGPCTTLRLSRTQVHNALDELLIRELHDALGQATADERVRVIVIAANGASFCAGADLAWMKRAALLDGQANFADARELAALLHALATCPKPVVAQVQGSAYGGGVGLICACDIAIGVETAQFALTEVRLGLAAATISPYVIAAIGARNARRLTLTGERFDAVRASQYGLLHEVVTTNSLDAAVHRLVEQLLAGGPRAQAVVKALIRQIAGAPLTSAMIDETARRLADIRCSDEGREGVAAFLEKRQPAWMTEK